MLEIVLPTYNRLRHAIEQINFISDEIKQHGADIKCIVMDNASHESDSKKIKNLALSKNIKYHRNNENLGLVGNLLESVNKLDGEYIWFVGDDDKLSKGLVNKVLKIINNEKPNFIFINHYATDEKTKVVVMESALPNNLLKARSLLDIYTCSGTTMMFITACVYKKSKLVTAIIDDKLAKDRITAPLYWSFYCAQSNNISIIQEKLINNVQGNTSWATNSSEIFTKMVPRELRTLVKLDYPISATIKIYFKSILTEYKFKLKKVGKKICFYVKKI